MQAQTITPDANHSSVELLRGFSLRESAGSAAAATVRLRKATVGGQILIILELSADQSANWIFPEGAELNSEGGVYVEAVAGTVEGVLFY